MGQFEYTVGLAAKPDEINRIALAFRAGEQKQKDRIINELEALAPNGTLAMELPRLRDIING